ncbi:hypothetical protein FACS1894186_7390 [Alphaproteobacteria bacterium]|nr:hypothetical protein FACS1894186_7390 [Alphaproteobacteria bacterium]
MRKFAVGLISSVIIVGCANRAVTPPGDVPASDTLASLPRIQLSTGMSQTEIEAALGAPSAISMLDDGGQEWSFGGHARLAYAKSSRDDDAKELVLGGFTRGFSGDRLYRQIAVEVRFDQSRLATDFSYKM